MALRWVALLWGISSLVHAQVLEPDRLGLVGWRTGDPIEVRADGEGGFWVRGPSGVLAVDENLRPRDWAAALYLGTRGGLEWYPDGSGFFVLSRGGGDVQLFHRAFPHGLAYPGFRAHRQEAPVAPELPWIQMDVEAGVGLDLGYQVWVHEEGGYRRLGQVALATSVCRTPEGVWVGAPGRLVRFGLEGGTQVESISVGHPLLVASGLRVAVVDPSRGVVRLAQGSEEGVVWDFWQALEAEAQQLQADFKGWALEQMASAVAPAYQQLFGDYGPWLDRLNLGRRLRSGFAAIRVQWAGGKLIWELDPDDRDTSRALDLVVSAVPSGAEIVQRRVSYRGTLPLDRAGARALWLQFIRGREVQEYWVMEDRR